MGNFKEAKKILYLYKKARGMHINVEKSTLLENGLPKVIKERIRDESPYILKPMDEGFKYLGFVLKPNAYSFRDWMWLYKKIEGRIGCWTYKLLSMGGRMVLLKVVLQRILVYWEKIAYIPKCILQKLRKTNFSFLWPAKKYT